MENTLTKKVTEIKCVIWDLDNTVWDGVLLESDDVKLKPGIKEIMIELDSRGILNSVASRNEHNLAMKKLKEFGLDEYILYPEINWNAKSKSVEKIQKNLNIGMDTLMFVDDQPFETEEVQSVHSEVTCIDALEYLTLPELPRLNPKFITEDSKRRRLMYQENLQRQEEEDSFEGPEEKFLASLDMSFVISEAKEEDLKRAEELTIRTNQLNATGRTYSFDELNEFRTSDTHRLMVCELTDKYGSYGKIGLALAEVTETHWHLRMLLMSCRVMSRGVGTVLLSHIMQETKAEGKTLLADFKQTDRNKMMYVAYRFANFKEDTKDGDDIVFTNDLSRVQGFPPYIDVQIIK